MNGMKPSPFSPLSHFTEGEVEAQRGEETLLWSQEAKGKAGVLALQRAGALHSTVPRGLP